MQALSGEAVKLLAAAALRPRGPTIEQLDGLARYDVLDTPREEAFDRVTRLVCHILSVEISTVTFLDGHRQWFKSRQCLDADQTGRDISFCQYPVAEGCLLIVPDALDDERFRANPLVVGEPHVRFYAGAPLHADNGACIGTLCAIDSRPKTLTMQEIDILLDLARIVETELELRILATTDVLTGVAARRAFMEEGERAVALARRQRYDLSCIAFDLDHFKAINDGSGHAAGDAVLVATAKTCAKLLRSSDIFGRLGGEEFAILLPYSDAARAAEVAERLRAVIEDQAKSSATPLQHVTASFGVATLDAARPELAGLLGAADAAVYVAKSRGRNGCAVAPPLVDEAVPGRKVLKAGQIVFNFGQSVVDCTVKRLSDTSALLDVIASAEIPSQFKLGIESDGFSRACAVLRRDERSLEVAFD